MKRYLIIGFLLLSFIFSSNLFAFQFESFFWGQTKDEILSLLKEHNKSDLSVQTDERISYSDVIFQNPCTVTMVFTFDNYELAAIFIEWQTSDVGNEVQKALIDRYGQPVQLDSYTRKYEWKGGFEDERLSLNYWDNARLSYYGGKYYEKYQKQLNSKSESEL